MGRNLRLSASPVGLRAHFAGAFGVRAQTLEHHAYQEIRRFPALDGVRAVSILLVLTAHLASQNVWGHLNGGNGVTIFFVLSGFLITTLALREETVRGVLNLRAFFTRRFFRIYPLYTVVLLLYVVLVAGGLLESARRQHFLHELPYYSLGFPEHANFFNPDVPFQVSWSLGIEEKYYLIWPLLGFVALVGRMRARLLVCLALVASLTSVQYATADARVVFPYVHILVGCVLALALHRRAYYDRMRWLGLWPILAVTIAGLLALDAYTGYDTSPLLSLPFTLVAALVLGGLVLAPSSLPARVLSTRPAVTIGVLSYGLYLVHQIGLNAVERLTRHYGFPGSLAELIVGATVGLGMAYVLHMTVEKPFIRLGHRLSGAVMTRSEAAAEQVSKPALSIESRQQ